MSPTTDLLLIGSYAARLRGVLPEWRNGRISDADFIVTPRGARQLAEMHGVILREHVPGRSYITVPVGVDLDMGIVEAIPLTVLAVSDEMDFVLNGFTFRARVAQPELILALRMHLTDQSRAKGLRDIAGYEALGITVSEDLLRAVEIFGPDQRR